MTPKLKMTLIGIAVVSMGMILMAPFGDPPRKPELQKVDKKTEAPQSDAHDVTRTNTPTGPTGANVRAGGTGTEGKGMRVQGVRKQPCRERCASVEGRLKRQCMKGCRKRKVFEACQAACGPEDRTLCIQGCRAQAGQD